MRRKYQTSPKICEVCADRASGLNYGALSCKSCKAFFSRSVQDDTHKTYTCTAGNNCAINLETRKKCRSCRFKKCLAIGMEASWVWTQEQKDQWRQKQEIKRRYMEKIMFQYPGQADERNSKGLDGTKAKRHRVGWDTPSFTSGESGINNAIPSSFQKQDVKEYTPDVYKIFDYMTVQDANEVKCLLESFYHAYRQNPFKAFSQDSQIRPSTDEIVEMITTLTCQFVDFLKLNPYFVSFSVTDQEDILKKVGWEMHFLRGAVFFDAVNNGWLVPQTETMTYKILQVVDVEHLVPVQLYEKHIAFLFSMKSLQIDEPIGMLLCMIVIFSHGETVVEHPWRIVQAREKYLEILRKYLLWRFGEENGKKLFPKFLVKLADLRELSDLHQGFCFDTYNWYATRHWKHWQEFNPSEASSLGLSTNVANRNGTALQGYGREMPSSSIFSQPNVSWIQNSLAQQSMQENHANATGNLGFSTDNIYQYGSHLERIDRGSASSAPTSQPTSRWTQNPSANDSDDPTSSSHLRCPCEEYQNDLGVPRSMPEQVDVVLPASTTTAEHIVLHYL